VAEVPVAECRALNFNDTSLSWEVLAKVRQLSAALAAFLASLLSFPMHLSQEFT
jgi:hypothetical protein